MIQNIKILVILIKSKTLSIKIHIKITIIIKILIKPNLICKVEFIVQKFQKDVILIANNFNIKRNKFNKN
jgi:hypothetical protein